MPARALQFFAAQKTGGNWTARRPSPPPLAAARPSRTGSRAGLELGTARSAACGAAFSLRLLIEQRFGESSPFSLGIEEEVMILDAETLALSPSVGLLIGESEKLELPGRLKTELFASIVELNTDTCSSVGEAGEALRELRRAAARIADENGLRIAAAGR